MRLKKGFTLAEVLIVLMVIGAIATLTIPSLMRGVQESQWKTAYKKAYNTVVNITAMERVSGQLPAGQTGADVRIMFRALNSSLSVKDYVIGTLTGVAERANFEDSLANLSTPYVLDGASASTTIPSPWINTDDGLSYQVTSKNGTTCGTKSQINAAKNTNAAFDLACVAVVVDVNGLSTGPNSFEHEIQENGATGDAEGINVANDMTTLSMDRYYIFISRDGAATSGSKKTTVTGRIASDLK